MLSFNLVFFGDTSFFGVLKILAIWVTYLAFSKFCEIFFLNFLHCNVVESVGIVIQAEQNRWECAGTDCTFQNFFLEVPRKITAERVFSSRRSAVIFRGTIRKIFFFTFLLTAKTVLRQHMGVLKCVMTYKV